LILPNLKAKKDCKILHKLYSYPAKFQANLPEILIKNLTNIGDLIVDAYSGGGTSSIEAFLQSRNSFAMDLNPISVLVSKAKITKLEENEFVELLKNVGQLRPSKKIIFLNEDEERLMGKTLSQFSSSVITLINKIKDKKTVFLLATVYIKRIKLSTRRDKEHLRTASFEKHIEYITKEIEKVRQVFLKINSKSKNIVIHGSNHNIPLKSNSVDLIITSPPYPNIDIEYNLIQLQRRDLNKCYRSDIAQRISQHILEIPGSFKKKELCLGGVGASDYWVNSELSLKEIYRILKKDHACFLYIGFKINSDKEKYEKLIEGCGFEIIRDYLVELGKERVASSRGIYHGRSTGMMKEDFLYVLRK